MEGEEVKWGVMTVISFIPLFNWLVRSLSPITSSYQQCSLLPTY